ncbi:hypothetical protein BOX15_Mlig017388g1 [Macrostomum lignano]|uniref:Uncharacterized protein n=1 Tax=Macrostomum lignano TaxID=282301 RepID=A0A267GHB8_9PLAT|nr:hypothetical protein BOX15_Mlig017388g1 [Macrostomum lignano]
MGQRYSSFTGSLPHYTRLSQTSTLAMLHDAIVEGDSEVANQLIDALRVDGGARTFGAKRRKKARRQQQREQQQLYLDYRGETRFGIEIRYSQTALALAIQFGQWDTFKDLILCGLSPRAQQRMLVPGHNGQSSTRDFENALDLFVWALTKASYYPPYLSEEQVIELIWVILRHGVSPDSLPGQLLHRVCQAAVLDLIGSSLLDMETSTVLQRSALSILCCLLQHGMNLNDGAISNLQPLYHLVLCYLANPAASLAQQLRSNSKLRLALCIIINAACNSNTGLPSVTAAGLTNRSWRSTASLWYNYAKMHGQQRKTMLVDEEDVARILRAHWAVTETCGGRPARLALLARNHIRWALIAKNGNAETYKDLSTRMAELPGRWRLCRMVEFMDEEFLAPEISAILSRVTSDSDQFAACLP